MATFPRATTLLIITVFIAYGKSQMEYPDYGTAVMVLTPRADGPPMIFLTEEAFDKWVELGIKMFAKIYDSICWYEQLKEFPFNSHGGYFSGCYIGIVSMAKDLKREWKCLKVFSTNLNLTGRYSLPDYHSKCEDLLLTPKATPSVDESSVLNDGEDDYAFKAYFHCLIHQVREKLGEKVIQTIKTERIDSKRDWMETINDRVNEFRSRHGVGALQLSKTLTDDAQKRADTMAESCTSGESSRDDLIQNICPSTKDYPDVSVLAYECVNHWYKEGMDYPFPKGVEKLSSERKSQYKNFANVVWKGSKSAGYGYKFNPKCGSTGKGFLVAQFHPVQKKDGEYIKNVFPPSS